MLLSRTDEQPWNQMETEGRSASPSRRITWPSSRRSRSTRINVEKIEKEHVEKIDSEQALEYSMQNKEGLSETMHLVPTGVAHEHAAALFHPTCAFRLLDAARFGAFKPPGRA